MGKISKQWLTGESHCSTLTALFDCVSMTSALVGNFARDCRLSDHQVLVVPMAYSSLFLATLSPSLFPLPLFRLPSFPPSLPPSLPPSFPPSLPLSLLPSLSPFLAHRYVVRRILRRGVRFCTEKLNAKPGVFASLVMTVVESLVRMYLCMWSLHSCCTIWFGMCS